MTTRLFALPAILVALFAVSGCYSPTDIPQAPEPRPKGEKTKAELLIGTWVLVKSGNEFVQPRTTILTEYRQDGSFTFQSKELNKPAKKRSGTYQLNGSTLRISADAREDAPAESWDVLIEVLTEAELISVAGPQHARQRSELKRV